MTTINKEFIYDQYVLSLVNNGEWYAATRGAVASNEYVRFAGVSSPFIDKLKKSVYGEFKTSSGRAGFDFCATDRRYILTELWEDIGGDTTNPVYLEAKAEIAKDNPPEVPKAPAKAPVPPTPSEVPPNHGADWTPEQDAKLLHLYHQCWHQAAIARELGRTERAITLRLEHLQQQSTARANRTGLKPIVTTYNPLTNQENTMSQVSAAKPIQHNTYVFGQDVDAMSTEQFIEAIKKLENQIAALDIIKAKSAKVKALKADLKAQLEQVVAVFDAK